MGNHMLLSSIESFVNRFVYVPTDLYLKKIIKQQANTNTIHFMFQQNNIWITSLCLTIAAHFWVFLLSFENQ